MEGEWIERIAVSAKFAADPCFKKSEELLVKKKVRTNEYIALPLLNKEGRLFAAVQVQLIDLREKFQFQDRDVTSESNDSMQKHE